VLGDQKSSVFEATKLDFSSLGTTNWQGIGRFDGRRFVWSMPEVMRRVTTSWGPSHIALARTGEWWIGTARGLYLFPPCRNIEELRLLRPLAAYGTGDGLATPMVYHLFEDSRGDLWISTAGETGGNGLARWTRTNRTIQNMAGTAGLPPLTDRLPVSIGEDKAGNVWVGFMPSGLARYSGGRFTFFTTDEGLPAGSIRTMYLDRAGHLWIGASRGGVSRVDDPSQPRPTFATVSSADGLSSNLVTALTEDLRGGSTPPRAEDSIASLPAPAVSNISRPPTVWVPERSMRRCAIDEASSGSARPRACCGSSPKRKTRSCLRRS
jgi:hypothetical protein